MPADLPAQKHPRPESRKEFQQAYENEQEQQNQLGNSGREDEEVATQSPEDQNEVAEDNADRTVEFDRRKYVLVKLSDIRKEVECPICLGIIQKTRTAMECMHRFCRECINKSMRLGNNECPACRTHCSSRRSLRDDPNFDALIAVLYPNVNKYEDEELTLHEEERERNKKIQTSIAETYRRQSEAVGKKRSFMRRHSPPQNHQSNVRITSPTEENDRHPNLISSTEDSSPDLPEKRSRRADNEDSSSSGSREELTWGTNSARSRDRHGQKSTRIARIVDFLRDSQKNDELNVHLKLMPEQGADLPLLPRPYLCCQSTVSIHHLRRFVALYVPIDEGDLEILVNSAEELGERRKVRVASAEETLGGLLSCSDLIAVKNDRSLEKLKELKPWFLKFPPIWLLQLYLLLVSLQISK